MRRHYRDSVEVGWGQAPSVSPTSASWLEGPSYRRSEVPGRQMKGGRKDGRYAEIGVHVERDDNLANSLAGFLLDSPVIRRTFDEDEETQESPGDLH